MVLLYWCVFVCIFMCEIVLFGECVRVSKCL